MQEEEVFSPIRFLDGFRPLSFSGRLPRHERVAGPFVPQGALITSRALTSTDYHSSLVATTLDCKMDALARLSNNAYSSKRSEG